MTIKSNLNGFAQRWKNRGMTTSQVNLLALLEAIQLLDKVAICKCAAHITNTNPVSKR